MKHGSSGEAGDRWWCVRPEEGMRVLPRFWVELLKSAMDLDAHGSKTQVRNHLESIPLMSELERSN